MTTREFTVTHVIVTRDETIPVCAVESPTVTGGLLLYTRDLWPERERLHSHWLWSPTDGLLYDGSPTHPRCEHALLFSNTDLRGTRVAWCSECGNPNRPPGSPCPVHGGERGRAASTTPNVQSLPRPDELLAAVDRAGFRVAKNIAHPFLGPTPEDQWCLWCKECGRDSGYHWETCSKSGARSVQEQALHATHRRGPR